MQKITPFYISTKNSEDADAILNISQELLFTPQMYAQSNLEEKKKNENNGFVIGIHKKSTLQKWIEDKKNSIILQFESETLTTTENLIGYTLLLCSEDIIDEVQTYAKNVEFLLPEAKKIIESRNFAYLIQIGVKGKYQKQGYGSGLFQHAIKSVEVPIISFVIKNPLTNYPSLYTHLKNGFQYMGDYTGEYGNFDNYRSVGLIYYPNSPCPDKNLLKQLFQKALK